ncbi:hypothetical protein C8J57DRAFT_1414650 [Mycena rebaudengoi]|nr:hypothetical protein C8J57DRAFT_1414650 [Mycena rebaudengoi]
MSTPRSLRTRMVSEHSRLVTPWCITLPISCQNPGNDRIPPRYRTQSAREKSVSLRPVIIIESPIVHITHQPQLLYSCNTCSITERPPVSAWQLVSRESGEDSTRVEMGESDRNIAAKDCQNLHCSSISGSERSQSASKLLLDCVFAHLKYCELRIIDRTPEKVPTSSTIFWNARHCVSGASLGSVYFASFEQFSSSSGGT